MANVLELSLTGKTFMRFEYHLIKLKNLDYRLFLESNNPLAFGLMAKMNYKSEAASPIESRVFAFDSGFSR